MQQSKIAVFTDSAELFANFRTMIPVALGEAIQVHSGSSGSVEPPAGLTLAFVDGQWPDDLRELCARLAGKAIYTVLVDHEKNIGDGVSAMLAEGAVDDLLVAPIRPIEVLGKLKHALHLEKVKEVVLVNADLKTLIEKFEEDIRTARSIQRSLIPEKFSPVNGFKVAHKYLSGLKSGGDYLDFFEFEDGTHIGMLLSDSTGYGLSSAFMSVLLKLAIKLSKDEFRSPSATIAKIFEELQLTMKPKENLSIFYGILNRKTFELTYASCGTVRFVHQGERSFAERITRGEPLVKGQAVQLVDNKLTLAPSDRIVVFSDGFSDPLAEEGDKAVERVFTNAYGEDAIELINNLSYRVKRKFDAPDDMPEQDCSILIVDVEKRAMRLAK